VEDYTGTFSPIDMTLRDLRTVGVLAAGLAALVVLVGSLFFRRRRQAAGRAGVDPSGSVPQRGEEAS